MRTCVVRYHVTTVYAAMADSLLVATGEGGRWARHERLADHRLEAVAAVPARPDRVFVGTFDAGLQRSVDGGATFERVGTDAMADAVTAVTVSPHDPGVVWAGTEPSRIYRSADGGESWRRREGLTDLPSAERWSFPPRPDTHHVRYLAVDPHDPSHLYVAIEAGAFVRTLDGGETWEPHPEGARRDTHTIATHPDAPCRVYAAAGDGYAESTDCGDTWTYPQDGLDHTYVWGLAVDPGDPDRVVVSAARGAYAAHSPDTAEAYVYRRSGGAWSPATDGLPDPGGTVRAVFATGGPGEFYALTNRGLFRSEDGAHSWTRLGVDWPDAYREQTGRGLAVLS